MIEEHVLFNPKLGEDYDLGYQGSSLKGTSRIIYGVYFGVTSYSYKRYQTKIRAHLFINLNNEGKLETYLANVEHNSKQTGNCPLIFRSDGEDDPSFSAVPAREGDMIKLSVLETNYAISRIKEIRTKNDQYLELQNKKALESIHI
ncbi:MAG: hypothetical protein ACP5N2_03580 [Candidatus Nanoarchaeia archaeon]